MGIVFSQGRCLCVTMVDLALEKHWVWCSRWLTWPGWPRWPCSPRQPLPFSLFSVTPFAFVSSTIIFRTHDSTHYDFPYTSYSFGRSLVFFCHALHLPSLLWLFNFYIIYFLNYFLGILNCDYFVYHSSLCFLLHALYTITSAKT